MRSLERGATDFFYKGPDGKSLGFAPPFELLNSVLAAREQPLAKHKQSRSDCVPIKLYLQNKQRAWLCANKTLSTKTGSGWIWPVGCRLLNPGRERMKSSGPNAGGQHCFPSFLH